MSISKSGNKSHDDAVNTAEGVRQVAVAAAATQMRCSSEQSHSDWNLRQGIAQSRAGAS